jgi:uncharacterized membrane protein YvbJ
MNCLRCNTQNEEGAKFCKSCGMDLAYLPPVENQKGNQTINQLLLLMGIEYLFSIGWLILQKGIVPLFYKKDGIVEWEKVSPIYKYFGWTTDILSIIVLLIFTIIIRNKNARIFLITFLVLRIIFLVSYRLFDEQ